MSRVIRVRRVTRVIRDRIITDNRIIRVIRATSVKGLLGLEGI